MAVIQYMHKCSFLFTSYSGSRGQVKESLISITVCMCLISPGSGETKIFITYCQFINPSRHSVELKKDTTTKVFQATSELYFCYKGLQSIIGLIQCLSLLTEVGGEC